MSSKFTCKGIVATFSRIWKEHWNCPGTERNSSPQSEDRCYLMGQWWIDDAEAYGNSQSCASNFFSLWQYSWHPLPLLWSHWKKHRIWEMTVSAVKPNTNCKRRWLRFHVGDQRTTNSTWIKAIWSQTQQSTGTCNCIISLIILLPHRKPKEVNKLICQIVSDSAWAYSLDLNCGNQLDNSMMRNTPLLCALVLDVWYSFDSSEFSETCVAN